MSCTLALHGSRARLICSTKTIHGFLEDIKAHSLKTSLGAGEEPRDGLVSCGCYNKGRKQWLKTNFWSYSSGGWKSEMGLTGLKSRVVFLLGARGRIRCSPSPAPRGARVPRRAPLPAMASPSLTLTFLPPLSLIRTPVITLDNPPSPSRTSLNHIWTVRVRSHSHRCWGWGHARLWGGHYSAPTRGR